MKGDLGNLLKNELGGSHIHTSLSGAVDNEVDSEDDAFKVIKDFLSYLPQNVWQMPPIVPNDDPSDRRDESLLSSYTKRTPTDVRDTRGNRLDMRQGIIL